MVHTSLPNELQQPFDKQVMAAIDELGDIFKYNTDMNSGNPLGTCAYYDYLYHSASFLKVTCSHSLGARYDWWWREE
jgi:hypothetical protein